MEVAGWERTFWLACGAFAGVMITAYLIHLSKAGTTSFRGAAYR